MSDQPEITFRQGPCSASVYKQEYERGGEKFCYRTTHFHRRYKDQNGDWQSSSILPVNDIPKAVIVLQKAYEYITSSNPYSHEEPEEAAMEIEQGEKT